MSYKNRHCKDGENGKNRFSIDKQKILLFLDERAVSDVVGNILMVAITVIMAAIVAGAIFGMQPPADVPHVSYEIKPNGTSNLDLMHMGGQQVKASDLKFMAEGQEKSIVPGSEINYTGTWIIGTTITLDTNNSEIMIVHLPSKELLQ